jgi:hypothetical protein
VKCPRAKAQRHFDMRNSTISTPRPMRIRIIGRRTERPREGVAGIEGSLVTEVAALSVAVVAKGSALVALRGSVGDVPEVSLAARGSPLGVVARSLPGSVVPVATSPDAGAAVVVGAGTGVAALPASGETTDAGFDADGRDGLLPDETTLCGAAGRDEPAVLFVLVDDAEAFVLEEGFRDGALLRVEDGRVAGAEAPVVDAVVCRRDGVVARGEDSRVDGAGLEICGRAVGSGRGVTRGARVGGAVVMPARRSGSAMARATKSRVSRAG